jgi:hypothetical protein
MAWICRSEHQMNEGAAPGGHGVNVAPCASAIQEDRARLASCTLTHMTEVMPSPDITRQPTGRIGSPQLLIRFGVVLSNNEPLTMTPRPPLAEVSVTHR